MHLTRFASIAALLISFTVLSLGQGLLSTLLGIRATIEEFSPLIIGLMTSGYYVGFMAGTVICAKLLAGVGHIRTFSVFASLSSAITLGFIMSIDELSWIALRAGYGVCLAALYMVLESWLNNFSTNENRGRILSIYMIINYIGIAFGQGFIFFSDPSSYALFTLVSILLSLALVPLSVSRRAEQPVVSDSESMKLRMLVRISPLATTGTFLTGLILGAFWGLGAVYLTQIGFNYKEIAALIAATYIGGLLLQWPIGMLSDMLNRRYVIALACAVSFVVCSAILILVGGNMKVGWQALVLAVLFGGTNYTLYSLFLSLANDFLEPEDILKASGTLLKLNALGSVCGPLLASIFMAWRGPSGLVLFFIIMSAATLLLSIARIARGPEIPEETSGSFTAVPRTTSSVMETFDTEDHGDEDAEPADDEDARPASA